MTDMQAAPVGDRRTLMVLAALVLGGGALLLTVVLGLHFYSRAGREAAAGPRERALVQAIAARDVAAAKAALSAGADLTVPIRARDDSGDMKNAVWLIVEELAGLGGVGSGRPRTDPALIDIARDIFAGGGNPNQSNSSSASMAGGGGGAPSTRYLIETAVLADRPELIDIMVGAGLEVKGSGAGEALVLACGGAHDEIALALVRAGANVSHRASGSGRTPLSEAVHHRRFTLVDALERAGALEWGAAARE